MRRQTLQLLDVSYRRGGRTILDRIDLTIRPGTRTALVGPSGAGKSTLLGILGGLQRPDSGTVTTPFAPDETAFVLQAYGLVALLTAAENVEVALQWRGLDRGTVRSRALDALEAVGLAGSADHLVEELSGGQQQRVAIARALAAQPRLLLADEFTAELDAERSARVVDLLLQATDGTTVVIATHDMAVAARCDAAVRIADLARNAARAEAAPKPGGV